LKIELKRIGPNGRASLIKLWEPQLTNLLQDFGDLNHMNVPQQSQQQQQQQIFTQQQSQNSIPNQMIQSTTSLTQSQSSEQTFQQQLDQTSNRINTNRIRRKQYVAIILLSLVGAEFGQDINSNQSQTPYKTIPQGFSLEDHSILKRISKCV
jgi:hypothetical protein